MGCRRHSGNHRRLHADKLNETPGAWDKANAYFNTLLASGLTEDEATWAAFAMATNIDFQNAGNDYQNTHGTGTLPWCCIRQTAPWT